MMKARNWILICFGLGLLTVFALRPAEVQARQGSPDVLAQQGGGHKIFLPSVTNSHPGPPPASNSYYMASTDPAKVTNEGCLLGKRDVSLSGAQDSVVVLYFGYPQKYADGSFGARGYGTPARYATTAQIAATVENFGVGYINCSGADPSSHLRISIGTSNYPGDAYSSVTAEHGKVWAQMVAQVSDWFINQCRGTACQDRVSVVGGNDIELSWNKADPTTAWVNGYASVANSRLYNFGALEGCPWIGKEGYTCNWLDKEKVWYIIWGARPVQPMPEIYTVDGVNAEQWYLMSVYSFTKHNQKIQFIGPMTQTGACTQYPESACKLLGNTSEAAWWQLYNLLNNDYRTAGEQLLYPTDIRYLMR